MKRIKLVLAVVAVMAAMIAASAAPAMADVRFGGNHVRFNDFNAGNGFIFFFSSSNFGGFDDGLNRIDSPDVHIDLD